MTVTGNDISRQQETCEAINGALYSVDFEHLGRDGQYSDWWTRGVYPKDVRVEVQRSQLAPFVIVNLEWRTNGVRGRQTLQIDCGPTSTRAQLEEGAERAVLRCLQTFKDVLQGVGVADPKKAEEVRKRE